MIDQAGFNSKLVRLKANGYKVGLIGELEFQFQIGAIKRKPRLETRLRRLQFQFQIGAIKSDTGRRVLFAGEVFQFQIGAIKSETRDASFLSISSFNSKLVRLKVNKMVVVNANSLSTFQFQIGAIKR